jgi:hypothetical protein
MLPDPLHPAVVHLPIALALLAPFAALLAALAIRAAWLPARAWAAVVLLQGLLVASAWAALETGEREEERVESVVRESRIEAHEKAAERFLPLAIGALVVSSAGLIAGRTGAFGRGATVAAAAGVLAAAVAVGHSGGELVYRHGAASAYATPTAKRSATGALAAAQAAPRARAHERGEDDD